MDEMTQSRADTMAQQYLDQLTRFLHALPEQDRSDAVREIASHIAESHAAGQPSGGRAGAPGRPARPGARVPGRLLWAATAWQPLADLGTSSGGLWIHPGQRAHQPLLVPVLGLLALVLGLAAPVVVVLGVLRFLGASWISIRLLPDTELPQVWSVPVTLAFALICVALAWGAAKLFRLYMSSHPRWVPTGVAIRGARLRDVTPLPHTATEQRDRPQSSTTVHNRTRLSGASLLAHGGMCPAAGGRRRHGVRAVSRGLEPRVALLDAGRAHLAISLSHSSSYATPSDMSQKCVAAPNTCHTTTTFQPCFRHIFTAYS